MTNKNIKRIIFLLLLIFLSAIVVKSCINADIPDKTIVLPKNANLIKEKVKYPGSFKTVTINGTDFKQARGEIGKFGGTLYSSSLGEGPKTFNPWESKDNTSTTIGELMFDGLVTTDAYTGQVIPQLARSVKVDKSGTQYTVELRRGLRWSDGRPITSDDVVFTWKDIIAAGLGNTSMRDNALIDGKMPNVYAIDKYTVKFITPKPFAPFLRQLGTSIAPKHILAPVTKQGEQAFSAFWDVTTPPNKLVTSGMFRLSRYIPAQRIEMVRNPNYYLIDKTGRRLPYLDRYVIYIVADLNNDLLKFIAGETDVLSVAGKNAAMFKELEKKSDFKLYNLGPDTGTMFAVFNLNRRKSQDGKYYVDPIKQKWFNDLNFRKAVDYAIDRDSLVSNILCGVGAPLFTAESLPSIFLNQKLKNGHRKDIKLAKKFLKESGFYWDKKGFLHDKEGNLVEFSLMTNAGNTEREATGVMIKQDLSELGMKVNFKPIEFNVLVGKLVDSFDWDMIIIALTGSPLDPHSGRNVWDSSGALHMFNQRKGIDLQTKSDLRPWEKQIDKIFESSAGEMDLNKRKAIYDKYQEIVYNERPFIYLYSSSRIYAVRNKFGNMKPTPLGGITHNLEEIYIK